MRRQLWFAQTASVALSLCLILCVSLTGTAYADSAESGRKGVLLVAFGTSVQSAKTAYTGVEDAFRQTGMPVVWAYTSNIIRARMARQGVTLFTVAQGLDELARQGVADVVVQSLHIMAGEEFSKMERLVLTEILAHPGRFQTVKLGRPLLESMRDAREVTQASLSALPADRQPGDAVLFMSHGQSEGRADLVFAGVKSAVHETDPLAFMASVEGYQGVEQVVPQLRNAGVKRVWLVPFMLVAGDHALNDLAGEEDSWASRLQTEGFEVRTALKGLGELEGVQKVLVRHALETRDDLANPVVKTKTTEE